MQPNEEDHQRGAVGGSMNDGAVIKERRPLAGKDKWENNSDSWGQTARASKENVAESEQRSETVCHR